MTDYTNKIAELQADVHTIWKLQCQNLYNSKNLAALAVRECLQNSLDAIKSAVSAGQLNTIVKLVKAGKLRKTLSKITQKQDKQKENFPIDFVPMSLEEIIEMAESYDLDIQFYQAKYTNEHILRMRLIMAIKKAYKEV